jgi:hypothetical protein
MSGDKRARITGKIGVERGERYALIPREVAESAAYNALPDYARSVLVALLLGFHGNNNGTLGLTFSQAAKVGVSAQWKLYAGLKILTLADLIVCTRRGRLENGTKLPSLYGVTWRGIGKPAAASVSYDFGVAICPLPTNCWARWEQPGDWRETVRRIGRANHGREKNPVSTTVGADRSTTVGATRHVHAQPRVEKETPVSAQPRVETSKTPGFGGARQFLGRDAVIARLMVRQPHLLDGDVARASKADVLHVARVRELLADGWRA